METKIQFQKNATIFAANGHQVGSLNRVVVNPTTMVLTDIVVRTGSLFNQEEKVVPTEFIDETAEDQIVLREDASDLDVFLPFEEEHIVDTEEDTEKSSSGEFTEPVAYGSPLLGLPIQPSAGEKFATRIDQNIPDGTVAMREGARVISADEKHVGNVERVLTAMPDEQVTHFLVSQGMFNKTMKLVPVDWVKAVNEDQVDLLVYKTSIDSLDDTSKSVSDIGVR